MSVFVDTGVFYAHHDRDVPGHVSATNALEHLVSGRHGRLYTSDYVYDETVTLARTRTGRSDDAKAVGDGIRGADPYPDTIELLHLTEELFGRSILLFERYDDHALSFTDASTVALTEYHGIDRVLSFDEDFDGLVDRLDPTEVV
ncbi:type II toxin-antitoxin system VapC family toxin [Natronorarus salvus]|uniref:type II toxin-antitoxin system VapC family toxin n=1 Tax=Natronorarus salvus TaxID=3117733 RepID=UPI002F264E4E